MSNVNITENMAVIRKAVEEHMGPRTKPEEVAIAKAGLALLEGFLKDVAKIADGPRV